MAEPLILRWLADPLLLAPALHSLMVARGHLPLLRSFADRPKDHFMASQNPRFAGGNFVALQPDRVPEIRELIQRTEASPARYSEVASAILELDGWLATDAGEGFEKSYPRVPTLLRGLVELTYDLRHRAAFRLLETLWFKSTHYQPAEQEVQLSIAIGDVRPTAMTTPRLDEPGRLTLSVPFADRRLDALFALRTCAYSADACSGLARSLGTTLEALQPFLAEGPPAVAAPFQGTGVQIRYLGHAALLFETRDLRILIDPTIPPEFAGATTRMGWPHLPEKIDWVLLTHGHADHFSLETLLQLRHRVGGVLVARSSAGHLADPSMDAALRAVGFDNVRTLDELETLPLGPRTRVTGLPFLGEHGDLAIRSKIDFLLEMEGLRLCVTSDAGVPELEVARRLTPLIQPLDAWFTSVEPGGAPLSWGGGAVFMVAPTPIMNRQRRQGGARIDELTALLEVWNPRRLYNYALAAEPWLSHVAAVPEPELQRKLADSDRLVAFARARGIEASRLSGCALWRLEAGE